MTDGSHPRRLCLAPNGRVENLAVLAEPGLRRLFDALDRDGESARVVGGAVRNTLLGRPVADVDVTTTATPDEVIRRVRRAGLRAIPTGLAHGTVTVMAGGAGYEVTTLREDVETDGRHAIVRFSRDFAADAARRDFTINALSLDSDGRLHDTTGGVVDLGAGRVRFIGDAEARIREDFLRILRFFRFHAAYGVGPLDADGLAAATRHRDALANLSRERVRGEWLKLLAADGAAPVIDAVVAAGIAERIVRCPCHVARFGRLAVLDRQRIDGPDPILRLAALHADTAADVAALRESLRLSNAERDRLVTALAARDAVRHGPPDAQGLRTLLFEYGPRGALDGLSLAAAGDEVPARWAGATRLLETIDIPRLPLGGADVVAQGVNHGRRVGEVLKRLQAAWIRAGFPDDPAELGRLLQAAIAIDDPAPPA